MIFGLTIYLNFILDSYNIYYATNKCVNVNKISQRTS